MVSLMCLAMAVYFEARSEPIEGQLAVAQVIVNRTESEGFPDTVCGVIHQGVKPGKNSCQFSFMCDGNSEEIKDESAYKTALMVASVALSPGQHDPSHGATFYHAFGVSPGWTTKMEKSAVIGGHIFYKFEG